MSIWEELKKLSVVLQIVVALVIVVPVIVVAVKPIVGGFAAPIPAWSVVVCVFVAFGLGLVVGRRLISSEDRISPEATESHSIMRFDYGSGDPKLHEWRIRNEGEHSQVPVFKSQLDGRYGRVLQITPRGSYYMDYTTSQDRATCSKVNVILKPGTDWFICFRVMVEPSSGSVGREVWLSMTFGETEPPLSRDSETEWKIEQPKKILHNEWAMLSIDLPEAVASTFGREGYRYSSLARIRIRGDMTIARIEFLRS